MQKYLTALNEWLTGLRGIMTTWSGVFLASFEDARAVAMQLIELFGGQVAEGGAAAAVVGAVVTAKLLVTDFWKRLQERVGTTKARR